MVLMGLIFSLFIVAFGALISSLSGGLFPINIGIWSIVLFPIGNGVLGFIGGAISALIYNLIAKIVGGIEIELEETNMQLGAM